MASIQEHKMIVKALERGVSVKRLAKVLNVAEDNLIAKRNMLDGICEDVVEMLKNKVQCEGIFKYLKKLKPYRQIEAVNLMIESNNFAIKFAQALYLATPDNQLVNPAKRRRNADTDKLYILESEVVQLQDNFKVIEEHYHSHVLNLTLFRGYLKKMLKNQRINKYIQTNLSELYEHFEEIVHMDSLD